MNLAGNGQVNTPAPPQDDLLSTLNLKHIRLSETAQAGFWLFFVLNLCFFPCIWGKKTMLESARDAPSILFQGAWAGDAKPAVSLRVLDPGAPAWQNDAWLKLIRRQYFSERILPLWNANQGYGQPLAANMLSQAFDPLTILLLLHLTPKTYNWFLLSRLFLAGLFAYLYARYFLSFFSSVGAGTLCMLGGYYILFISISHLSVEILLPLGLFVAEYALRKRNLQSVFLFAAMILLVFVAGMPESALLLFCFVYAYWLFRLLSDPELRTAWRRNVWTFVSATIAGLSLSMFLLLPFFEYMVNSFSSHEESFKTGLLHDKVDLSAGAYILPLLYGLPYSNAVAIEGTVNRNYSGALSVFLVLVACAALVRTMGAGPSVLKQLTWFFVGSIALIAMKRYGIEPVNQIGRLPLFALVDFRKYDEPILSLCVAMLSAIGMEWLIRREIPRILCVMSFGMTAVLTGTVANRAWPLVRSKIMHGKPISTSLWALILGAILLCTAASCIWFSERGRRRENTSSSYTPRKTGIYLLAMVTVQACCVYIIPVYYIYSPPPHRSNNPYVGAPFVDFLKDKTANNDRIVGRDGVLVPNWASAFGLYDIRNHDAMNVRKYFPFLDNFFVDYKKMAPELQSTYRGLGSYDFATPLEQRLLQISSVRFLATQRPYVAPDPRIEEILAQNRGRLIPGKERYIGNNGFALADGFVRAGLLEHPPYARLPYRLRIGSNQSAVFHFSYGINPQVYDKSGDGVGFKLEVRDPTGNIAPLFFRYIDPKHNAAERGWLSDAVDLRRYRGQSIELLFSTDPGPRGDTTYDWAVWSDLHFDSDPAPPAGPPFKQVYAGAASIFEYDHVLPRAALFYHADLVKDENAVLRRLADPSLDVFRSVVLNSSTLDGSEFTRINGMDGMSPKSIQAAKIVSYGSQNVTIEATLDRPGILMLNDTGYPGWVVNIDRRPGRWFSADYLFRGVFLGPGKHSVQFIYKPASFIYGAAISAIAAALMVILGIKQKGMEFARRVFLRRST